MSPSNSISQVIGLESTTSARRNSGVAQGARHRRVPDPADGRARLVTIAGRGEAAVAVARAAEAEVEAEWARHLGKQATAQLRRALERLRELTDPYG